MRKLVCVLLMTVLLLNACVVLAEVKWTFPVSIIEVESEFGVLVNKEHTLKSNFKPSPLVKAKGLKTATDMDLQETAYNAIAELFSAAEAEGYKLILKSGYRSYSSQKVMYANRLERMNGVDDGVVQMPGASEHQTGLCADILSVSYEKNNETMKEDFKLTEEAQWLKENCDDFGLILRYPEGKEEITGIIFEPWHFRYVGKNMAGYIMANDLCLEEFYEEFEAAKAEFEMNGGDLEAERALELAEINALPESLVLDQYGEDGDAEVTLDI